MNRRETNSGTSDLSTSYVSTRAVPGATTLERIESFLPDRCVKIDELAEELGLRRAEIGVFRKIHGLNTLRFDPDMNLFDLVMPPARRALAALPQGRRVDYLVFAHTVQAVTPPGLDPAAVIRDSLGLHDAEAFALSHQACVSSMGAIDVAAELLRADGVTGSYALMVTGERAFSPKVQLIPDTAIMADAAAACLITIGGSGDEIHSYVTRTLGEYSAGLLMTKEQAREFGHIYGRTLAGVIQQAVAAAGLDFGEIELVIPHNVNMVSWRQTIKEMGADPQKFFLANVSRIGHCYSADIFVNYTTLREAGRLVEGGKYVLASVGIGATFGAMVITHRSGEPGV
jgi:3-oxoacyl-[acyl-carrier-protein] synthase-3